MARTDSVTRQAVPSSFFYARGQFFLLPSQLIWNTWGNQYTKRGKCEYANSIIVALQYTKIFPVFCRPPHPSLRALPPPPHLLLLRLSRSSRKVTTWSDWLTNAKTSYNLFASALSVGSSKWRWRKRLVTGTDHSLRRLAIRSLFCFQSAPHTHVLTHTSLHCLQPGMWGFAGVCSDPVLLLFYL